MSTGAGIAAAAGIGAVGSLVGASEQSDAYEDAASAQMAMYRQTREDLAPYRDIGYAALDVLGQMFIPGYGATSESDDRINDQIADLERERDSLGGRNFLQPSGESRSVLGGANDRRQARRGGSVRNAGRAAEINRQIAALQAQRGQAGQEQTQAAPDYSAFYKSPGYEFRFDEGTRALDRSASARGRLRSGAHERELIRYGQGVASSEFNNYANRLASLAGLGQTSTGRTGQAGASAASSQGAYLAGAGTARASGYVGAANAATQGIGNYLYFAGLQNQGQNP